MLDLKRTRYFVAVAEAGGFTRAALSLGVGQPTLSRHVAALEASLGAALLDRRSKPLTLTPAGAVLVREGRALLERADRIASEIRSLKAVQERGGRSEQLRARPRKSARTRDRAPC